MYRTKVGSLRGPTILKKNNSPGMPAVWSDAVAAWEGNEISFFILQDSLLWMGAGSVEDHQPVRFG